MKKITMLFYLLGTCFSVMAINLTENGKSDYVISVPATAIESEITAAKELQSYVKQISGAELPIIKEVQASGKKVIYIGQSPKIKKLLGNIDFTKLKADEIIIKTIDEFLVLSGQRPRGTLYAVNTFIENQLGVRWWTSTESYVPKDPNIKFSKLNIRYAPVFSTRETHYADVRNNELFGVRLKNNGRFPVISKKYGGHNDILGVAHTFDSLVPSKEFFGTHPEWYSMINGIRRPGGTRSGQLCLSNKAVLDKVIKRATDWLEKNPGTKTIAISQNDNPLFCRCPNCAAIDKQEGSPAGSVIRFVNKVAEALGKRFPGVQVETLAYQYSRTPPQITKPRHNVVVRLCTYECDFSKPLNSVYNAEFRKLLMDWSKICKNLAVWNYVANFGNYLIPHPNIYNLKRDIKFFAQNNVVSVFEQGDKWSEKGGDLVQLRAWLIAHLLWNPKLNANKLIYKFLRGYYGNAAPYIKKYIKLINAYGNKGKAKITISMPFTSSWLPLSALLKARELMKSAGQAVKNDKIIYDRVKRLSLNADIALLTRIEASKNCSSAASKILKKKINLKKLLDSTVKLANKYEVKSYIEGANNFDGLVEKIKESLFNNVGEQVNRSELPSLCKNLNTNDFIIFSTKQIEASTSEKSAFRVNDKNALHGKAIMMPSSHTRWATKFTPPPISGKWKVYFSARCDASPDNGKAFLGGIYSLVDRKMIAQKIFDTKKVKGMKYKLLKFCSSNLSVKTNN